MRWTIRLLLLGSCLYAGAAAASPADANKVQMLPSRLAPADLPREAMQKVVAEHVDISAYRTVRAQVIYRADGKPDHLLVYLHAKGLHRVDYMKISLSTTYGPLEVIQHYRLTPEDHAQQPGASGGSTCPDTTVQFIAIAPNNDDTEQSVTKDVASHAEAKGLKVKRLLLSDATRQNWLDYMSCPNLLGNFYDGDADPSSVVTVDGELTNQDFSTTLSNAFRLDVTNIWLACEAFNDPMLGAVKDDAQSRKYGAGINDLAVGPSDNAAACAMKAAVDGQPMTAAFATCRQQFDTPSDDWGFDGKGTDNFYN